MLYPSVVCRVVAYSSHKILASLLRKFNCQQAQQYEPHATNSYMIVYIIFPQYMYIDSHIQELIHSIEVHPSGLQVALIVAVNSSKVRLANLIVHVCSLASQTLSVLQSHLYADTDTMCGTIESLESVKLLILQISKWPCCVAHFCTLYCLLSLYSHCRLSSSYTN